MNIPAIRKALLELERIERESCESFGCPAHSVSDAVVAVGLRACDECDETRSIYSDSWKKVSVIADILREAGVEVEG
jgi:hypothetical protein